MSDYLVELGQKQWFRKVSSTLGLPIPIPQALERADTPMETENLKGRSILIGGEKKTVAAIIKEAGATQASSDGKVSALVFDGRKVCTFVQLEEMYTFFHNNIRRLDKCGRFIVIARQPGMKSVGECAACSAAVTGFIKSAAKEIGKKGATANVIYVEDGADTWLEGPLRWILSPRSAFVNAQVFNVANTTFGGSPKPWEQPLAGRVALVTGAAQGIGAAIATRVAEEGAEVLALDIPQSKAALNALCDKIGAAPLAVDITARNAIKKILQASDKRGGLDIAINNAGITRDKTLANMKPDYWNQCINVNLAASLAISEATLNQIDEGGRVICLSSIAGIAGNFGQTNYAAAKAGLIGAVRRLAPDFAAKGATINAVAPGFVETKMTASVPFVTREAGRRLASLGQGGIPVDIAELITFLVTPGASGINGEVIRACGGNYLGS